MSNPSNDFHPTYAEPEVRAAVFEAIRGELAAHDDMAGVVDDDPKDMPEWARRPESVATGADEQAAAPVSSPTRERIVPLDFLPDGYFAVADCQDCEGSGLVEVEMGGQARYTDTCECVFEDAAGDADGVADAGSHQLADALAGAEAACDRIHAAAAHTAQGTSVDTAHVALTASADVEPYVAESRADVDAERGL